MKHWHKCSRWNAEGFRCPFRLLELTDEREPEDDEVHKLERHAAQAEATATAQVPAVVRRELSLVALAEVVVALGTGGSGYDLLDAVSTTVVPPFETAIEIPQHVPALAEVILGKATGGTGQQPGAPVTAAIAKEAVVPAQVPQHVQATAPRPPAPQMADPLLPRLVETTLIKLLADATAPAAAEARPGPVAVGAPYSRGASAEDEALFVSAQNPRSIDLSQAYLIEAALIAAVAFGTIESIRAFRNAKGTAFTNNPVGGFRGAKPILNVPAPKKTAPRYIPSRFKGTPVGGGPLPGNSSLLRDLGASLVQAVKRGPQ